MFKKVYSFFVFAVLYYLRFFAWVALLLSRPKIIGITGSVGKSSARNAIDAILKDHFKIKVIKEGNSETGVPLGILGINPGHYRLLDWLRILFHSPFRLLNLIGIEYLVVEMGIDSPLPPKNMDYLLTIVKPEISVVLNAYPVHTQQFEVLFHHVKNKEKKAELILKRIAEEKLKIITSAKPRIGIYNESFKLKSNLELLSFGKSEKASLQIIGYEVDLKKTVFKYLDKANDLPIDIEIKNYLLPEGYSEIFAATVLVGRNLGLTIEQIIEGLDKNFSLPKSRGSLLAGLKLSLLIDSSYNASRASVLNFIDMSALIAKKEDRPLVLVLGDMRELGGQAEIEHHLVADKILEVKPDLLIFLGPLTKKYIIPRLKKKIRHIKWSKTSILAGEYLRRHLPYRGVILFKGSQNELFLEEAIKKILKDKEDIDKLCRQNDFWIRYKTKFFLGSVTTS